MLDLRPKYGKFFERASAVVGDQHIVSGFEIMESFEASVSAEERRIDGVIYPATHDQVRQLVLLANEFSVPLYPISTGKNWGIGSKLPAVDHCVVLDLSRMHGIEYDAQSGYVVVEPGVTQRQVYEYLELNGGRHYLDTIGSAADTSIIGNVLEGGVGYRGLRFDQATGFEVVTGRGETIQTGFGHFGKKIATTHLYKHGLGASLDGLFHQSNFGIVVSMGLQLFVKPECQMAAVISITDDADFLEFMRRLIAIKRLGLTPTSVKIGNRERSRTTICPLLQRHLRVLETDAARCSNEFVEALFAKNFGAWSAVMGLMGTHEMVRAMRVGIEREMRGFGRVKFVDQRLIRNAQKLAQKFSWIPAVREQLAVLRAIEPLQGLMAGIPTDDTLPSLWWAIGEDVPDDCRNPDVSSVGMIAYLPLLPAEPSWAQLNVEVTQKVFEVHGFVPNITMSIISDRAMWGVTDLAFNRRDPGAAQRATQAISELEDAMLSLGIMPQRLRIDAMSKFVREGDTFWQSIREMKKVFDPNNIIAPGRYNLV